MHAHPQLGTPCHSIHLFSVLPEVPMHTRTNTRASLRPTRVCPSAWLGSQRSTPWSNGRILEGLFLSVRRSSRKSWLCCWRLNPQPLLASLLFSAKNKTLDFIHFTFFLAIWKALELAPWCCFYHHLHCKKSCSLVSLLLLSAKMARIIRPTENCILRANYWCIPHVSPKVTSGGRRQDRASPRGTDASQDSGGFGPPKVMWRWLIYPPLWLRKMTTMCRLQINPLLHKTSLYCKIWLK